MAPFGRPKYCETLLYATGVATELDLSERWATNDDEWGKSAAYNWATALITAPQHHRFFHVWFLFP
ncbi:hypothetical protein OUZ56_007725 [Daphnia magna]|uniref:Uncharacterized protein n=1 Tax=Daphnia magna TaxID=35525 RepID=A0ABR0AAU2_9CRUS|nr:hypothetical protein OUZ56_007725 [Daphnia magna]